MVVRWFSKTPTETNVEEPTVQLPINALKEWTGKARATVIFDSTIDEFTRDGLFDNVKAKPNIAIVGFTTDGDVFGVLQRCSDGTRKILRRPEYFCVLL